MQVPDLGLSSFLLLSVTIKTAAEEFGGSVIKRRFTSGVRKRRLASGVNPDGVELVLLLLCGH